MRVYAYELTIGEKGTLTINDLPLDAGEKIEVIIISRASRQNNDKGYPFWGKPITYLNPNDSVAEAEWEVLQ